MRRRLPRCPFCVTPDGFPSRMKPQLLENGLLAYVCPNCHAVAPYAKNYALALEKANTRSEAVIAWNDRKYEPDREDEYLCEYSFSGSDEKPVNVYHGVMRWDAKEHIFKSYTLGFSIKVIRWMDFKKSCEAEVAV